LGLAQAMSLIADDRHMESVTREVLSVFTGSPDRWLTTAEVARRCLHDAETVGRVLTALAAGCVLDFEAASGGYRYHQDTVLDLEIRRFIRRADGHERLVRTNVDRFRQRYGGF
jgi:hypothetical protein